MADFGALARQIVSKLVHCQHGRRTRRTEPVPGNTEVIVTFEAFGKIMVFRPVLGQSGAEPQSGWFGVSRMVLRF